MDQFDINEFAKMFDAALASDNPTVKKALRNFMMVAALVHAQEEVNNDERLMGPLETLVKKVSDLERMVYELQHTRTKDDTYRDYYKQIYGTGPTWVYSPNTSTTSGTSSVASSSTKSWSIDYDVEDLKELMKDLKFT